MNLDYVNIEELEYSLNPGDEEYANVKIKNNKMFDAYSYPR